MYKRLIPASILIAALCGCDSTRSVNTIENEPKYGQATPLPNKRTVTDSTLDSSLELLRVDSCPAENSGIFKVQMTFRSTRTGYWDSNDPMIVAYNFVWLDKNGMEVQNGATSIWIEKSILPGETVIISGVSPSPECKDFYLKLRELK